MARKVVRQGRFTQTAREGSDAFANWPGGFTSYLGKKLDASECTCVFTCAEDPKTACSLSGEWHVHPDNGLGIFGPCPEHPDAPGDL